MRVFLMSVVWVLHVCVYKGVSLVCLPLLCARVACVWMRGFFGVVTGAGRLRRVGLFFRNGDIAPKQAHYSAERSKPGHQHPQYSHAFCLNPAVNMTLLCNATLVNSDNCHLGLGVRKIAQ